MHRPLPGTRPERRDSDIREAAFTYAAVPEDEPGLPSVDYFKHIIEGAIAHSFPDEYVEALRMVRVVEDVDAFVSVDRVKLRIAAMDGDE